MSFQYRYSIHFVYYYCLRLKSQTFIFLFLLGLDMFMFLSSHGSSLVGLLFSSLGCLSVVFVYETCAVPWSHRLVQRPSSWRRVQYFVTDHVVGDFLLSFFVDRRGGRTCSGCLSFLFRCWSSWQKDVIFDYLPQLRELME